MFNQMIYIFFLVACLIRFSFLRLMKAQSVGDTSSLDFMKSRRVFEVNPEHPIIKNLDVRKSIAKFIHSFANSCKLTDYYNIHRLHTRVTPTMKML